MTDLWLNVRQAWRGFLRRPGFSITAVLTLALGMGRILESQLYQVFTIDPVSMALSGLAVGMVTLLVSLIPARQAARVDPVVAQRSE
jgi:ABC-type antimicrobial peptide transport system permease subunit